ncbi:hypothetical protein DVH24_037279 [Malus domestica]|uniref:Uncharacterized protein n=1 Tax=Malus domestica TaxID=3750 RepID=A0A498HJ23_MALDO|nr:hypothetical protein DVH24_037279 [Malus domestica]
MFLTLHPSAITATDSFGDTALHNATYKGCEQFVEELVQLMTEEQLETKNNNGQTAFTIAAAKSLKIVKCLVAKNKKLLSIAKDSSQMTPILIAAKKDRWDIVRIRRARANCGKAGAVVTEEQLETKNDDGETALTIAAANNLKIVKCLVAKNKKLLGIAQDSSQMTPILIAAKKDRWDIVRYLYSVTPLEDLMPDKGPWGSELVCYCLQAKQFGNETTLNRIKFSALHIIYR